MALRKIDGLARSVVRLLAVACVMIVGTFRSLFYAALKNHRNVMELLLDSGANVNARTDYSTPLIIAVRAHDAQAVDLLLKHGADPSIEPRYRPSALALTAEDEDATAIHDMLSAALPISASPESQEIKCDVPAWMPVYPGTNERVSTTRSTIARCAAIRPRRRGRGAFDVHLHAAARATETSRRVARDLSSRTRPLRQPARSSRASRRRPWYVSACAVVLPVPVGSS
jgi:hypothetical protein